MGITKDYLRFEHSGSCGCVASQNGAVVALTNVSCAATACEAVHVYNLRTADKVCDVSEGSSILQKQKSKASLKRDAKTNFSLAFPQTLCVFLVWTLSKTP